MNNELLFREIEAHSKRLCKDCGQPHSKHTLHPYETICPEPTPEWRELGPDEVIGADDEYNPASLGQWIKVPHGWIGEKCDITRIRTRRPLPKQEEMPKTIIWDSYPPKQEEMPLEKELDYLTREASRAADIHNHVLIVDCLRYLRDEIQKLKQTN